MSEPTHLTHIGFRRAIYNANLQKLFDMESIFRKKNQRNTRLFHLRLARILKDWTIL